MAEGHDHGRGLWNRSTEFGHLVFVRRYKSCFLHLSGLFFPEHPLILSVSPSCHLLFGQYGRKTPVSVSDMEESLSSVGIHGCSTIEPVSRVPFTECWASAYNTTFQGIYYLYAFRSVQVLAPSIELRTSLIFVVAVIRRSLHVRRIIPIALFSIRSLSASAIADNKSQVDKVD